MSLLNGQDTRQLINYYPASKSIIKFKNNNYNLPIIIVPGTLIPEILFAIQRVQFVESLVSKSISFLEVSVRGSLTIHIYHHLGETNNKIRRCGKNLHKRKHNNSGSNTKVNDPRAWMKQWWHTEQSHQKGGFYPYTLYLI